jgi:hypothetical protein
MDAGRSGNSPARLEGRTKIVALLRAIVSLGVVTVLVPTGGKPAAGGIYTVTDRALGLSLTVPRTWIREPAGKFASGYLAFVRPQPGRQEGISELVVEPLGVTKVRDPRRAARAWACGLTKGLAFPVRRVPVRYGGVPGLMLLGMPGQGPNVQIVLAHDGAVYLLVAFGTRLNVDQQGALARLWFVPRTGRFPVLRPGPRPCAA